MKRKVHRILAWICVIPFLWIATTGSLLGIAKQWQKSRYPYHISSQDTDHELRNDAPLLITQLENDGRLKDLKGIQFPSSSHETIRVNFSNGETWFLDPTRLERLEESTGQSGQLISLLTQLHRGKYWGPLGRYLFSASSLIFLSLVATGLTLFSKRRFLKWNSERNQHANLGALVSLPLLLLLSTGGIWNISEELRGLKPLSTHEAPSRQSWEEAWIQARSLYPSSPPEGIFLSQGRLMVEFSDSTRIYFESGRPLLRRDWFQSALSLHSGKSMGSLGEWIPISTGILTLALLIQGGKLLLERRRQRRGCH